MKEDRKIIPDKIQLLNIKTLKGNIESSDDADETAIVAYRYGHTLGTGINIDENLVALKLTIDIEALGIGDTKLGIHGSYTHSFTFRIENLEDFIEKDQDELSGVDPIMISALIGISYSTVRGIIYNRTQSTALNAVILPVIDPKELLKIDDGNVK